MNDPADERIRLWKPKASRRALDDNGISTNLGEQDLERIQKVLGEAYAPQTRSTYGTGLFVFHSFCDHKNILEEHRAPVDHTVLASFISTLVGTYGGNTIRNYIYGVRAWHIIHGIKWEADNNELETLLKAGHKLTPKEARRKAKEPWTTDYLTAICQSLKRDKPKDAAVLTCLTTAFWGTARLSEVTVKNPKSFDPNIHVKVSNVRYGVLDKNKVEVTAIFIPWTKVAREKGEDIFWAKQHDIVDPESALANHMKVNNPPPEAHLFAYKYRKGHRPMTRNSFLQRINKIVDEKGLNKRPGHGIRVGSTLEYLLRGVPFPVVKAKGRWQSDAFKGYLRNHAQIMAPYMQAVPGTYETFIANAMPPIC